MTRLESIALLTLIMFVLSTTSIYGDSNNRINWRVISNPSTEYDGAYSVCEYGDYIYIVGIQNGFYSRIERRLKETGELVNFFVFDNQLLSELRDCIIVNETLYAIGSAYYEEYVHWLIVALDLELNQINYVTRRPSSLLSIAESATSDSVHIYIAGFQDTETGSILIIEKINSTDLSVVKVYENSVSNVSLYPIRIDINPATDELWVAEILYNYSDDSINSRVEVLNRELEQLKTLELKNITLYSIAFDEEGYGYLSGVNFSSNLLGLVVKLDSEGNPSKSISFADKIVLNLFYANPYLYSITYYSSTLREATPYLTVFDKELNIVYEIPLSFEYEILDGKMTCDSENLYLAGIVFNQDAWDCAWVIYSIKLLETPPGGGTETVTVTKTVTITYTFTTLRETTYTFTETVTNTETVVETNTFITTETFTVTSPVVETLNVTSTETVRVDELTPREIAVMSSGLIVAILAVVSVIIYGFIKKK